MYSIISLLLKRCTFSVMILMFPFLAERSVALGGNVGVLVTAARGVCGVGWSTVVLLLSFSVSYGKKSSDGSLLFIIIWLFCLFLSLLLLFSFFFCFIIIFSFSSSSFRNYVCASYCSGGLFLEVAVVAFTCFRAFARREIAFGLKDSCV